MAGAGPRSSWRAAQWEGRELGPGSRREPVGKRSETVREPVGKVGGPSAQLVRPADQALTDRIVCQLALLPGVYTAGRNRPGSRFGTELATRRDAARHWAATHTGEDMSGNMVARRTETGWVLTWGGITSPLPLTSRATAEDVRAHMVRISGGHPVELTIDETAAKGTVNRR